MKKKNIKRNKKYSKGVFLYLPKDRENLAKQINFINSLSGVNHVEVWIEENLSQSELKTLKSFLKKYEIIIHAPWVQLSLISPHPEIREVTIKLYLQTLKIADKLKAKLVTFHCGGATIYEPKAILMERLAQNLKKIKSYYKGKTAFTIENIPATPKAPQVFYPAFDDLVYLKKKLPWLNFTLDVGHTLRDGKSLKTISAFFKKYSNSILDIHLHDAISTKEKDHLALGEGQLNVNNFFWILNKVGYRGYISLETTSNQDTRKSWQKIYKL